MGRELRREPRVRTNFDVEIETAGRKTDYPTRNASFSGLFLVTTETLPLRRLVRVRAEISGEQLELVGLVAHTVNAADAHEFNKDPGMGISLFSLGQHQRAVWEEYVRTEYEKDPEAHAALIASELPRLKVALKNDKMKEQFFGNDLPSGEIFYRTPDLMAEGTQVVVSGTIAPNLRVSYGVGVFSPVNTLTLRYQLTSRLALSAMRSLENALDLFYTFEF